MLFDRYKEVTERCLELGEKMDILAQGEGIELRQLLEEREWLAKTITRQVKGVLEEVRDGIEFLRNWIEEEIEKVEKASSRDGIPADVLDMEKVMDEATVIRDRARELMLEKESGECNAGEEVSGENVYPKAAEIRIDLPKDEDNIQNNSKMHVNYAGEINKAINEAAVSVSQPTGGIFNKDIIASLENKLDPGFIDKQKSPGPASNNKNESKMTKKEQSRKSKKKKK
ncbi:MAG: hypothetical protein K9L17_13915 [Clostridiales bacterium]|nr:hypothetical protein [Clostridiales bacterium]MCF8023769.1 hypothetical protein [Clostridiales bacterium]